MLGRLKLHLKEANLQHNDAGFLERMSPMCIIRVGDREQRSAVVMGGGRHPIWTLQFFEFEILDLNHEVYIEIRDKDMIGSDMIGHLRVPARFFVELGCRESEWMELKFMGMPAGNVHFKTEYFPQGIVGGGMMAPAPMVTTTTTVEVLGRQGVLKMHAVEAHL